VRPVRLAEGVRAALRYLLQERWHESGRTGVEEREILQLLGNSGNAQPGRNTEQ